MKVIKLMPLVLVGCISACSEEDVEEVREWVDDNLTESASSSSSTSASSSGSTGFSLTLEENSVGFCSAQDADVTIDTKHTGFIGEGFIDTANALGSDIAWQVEVAEAGEYVLSIRFANGGTTARSGTMIINDDAASSVNFELAATGAWTTWSDEKVSVSLNAGNNLLKLTATSEGGLSNIDSMTISGPSEISGVDCAPKALGEVTVSNAEEFLSVIDRAVAGDIINLRAGTYALDKTVTLNASGEAANKPITLRVHPEETGRPVFDFSAMEENSANRGFRIRGNFWHVYGIDVTKAGDNCMLITGSNNIVEFSNFYECADTGLQLASGASENLILNCDSYFNADTSLENADGFAAKLNVGSGNRFVGCRAWNNLDDGWDGYLREADGITTTYENCWAFNNGYLKDGTAGQGDGNGFKTGGSDTKDLKHHAIYRQCIAAGNLVDGFDHNSNRGTVTILNSVAHKNTRNIYFSDTNGAEQLTIKNTISLDGEDKFGAANKDITNNSWQLESPVSDSGFASLDLEQLRAPRKADGSLPDIDYMKPVVGSALVDAGVNIGLSYQGAAPDLGAQELPLEAASSTVVWRPAELFNSPTFSSTVIEGDPQIIESPMGPAVTFDGVDDRLLVDQNPLFGVEEFTIETIIYPNDAYPNNVEPRYFHIESGTNKDRRVTMELRLNDSNQWYLDAYIKSDNGSLTLIDETLVHPTGQWFHAAITYKSKTFTSYVNGVQELTGEVEYLPIPKDAKSSIGARMNEIHWLNGGIQSITITPKALTPEEFKSLGVLAN